MTVTDALPRPPARRAIAGTFGLLALQLVTISLIYKHAIAFTCRDNWPGAVCSGASGAVVSLIGVLAALCLFALLAPEALRRLLALAGARRWPLAVNLAGALLVLVPTLILHDGAGASSLWPTLAFWTLGMAAMLAGLALYLAPLPRWHGLVQDQGSRLLPLILAGGLAPLLADQARPLWRLDAVADLTFAAVARAIRLLGYAVEADPVHKTIGTAEFYINVAPVCSGVEGIALVTIFVTLYLVLFRADLRIGRALLLYPIGIAVSAALNVVRITLLLALGLDGHPELAVGGFHSHAGWLMFTLVALGLVALAHAVPFFHRPAGATAAPPPPALPLRTDPVAARILPFAVFMFSALLASTFTQTPGVVYPLRVLAVGAALAVFAPLYARLPWRLDPAALLAGAGIGLLWVLIPVPAGGPAPYGVLTGTALAGWLVLRGLGTVVLVPLVEELFFRDYLESRLRLRPGLPWTIGAALVTAGLFAALHDRWAEAFVAGLVFSWVARRGRIPDAILAHAVANAVVYAVALSTGQMQII